MAVSVPLVSAFSSRGGSHPSQCQDKCNTERRFSADINPCDLSSLCSREPATLEMANSIGRDCTLLDKYDHAVVTRYP